MQLRIPLLLFCLIILIQSPASNILPSVIIIIFFGKFISTFCSKASFKGFFKKVNTKFACKLDITLIILLIFSLLHKIGSSIYLINFDPNPIS